MNSTPPQLVPLHSCRTISLPLETRVQEREGGVRGELFEEDTQEPAHYTNAGTTGRRIAQ